MHEHTVRATIASGTIEGFTRDGVNRWRAIPYAKPPVVIHDIGKAPSGLIQKSDFDGWTNSATQIFVHSKANVSPATLFVTIHH